MGRNCANIQQVLILKFAFGPEKFSSLSRNGPFATCWICSRQSRVQIFGRSCKQPTGCLLPFVVFDPVMFYFIILFSTELFEWNVKGLVLSHDRHFDFDRDVSTAHCRYSSGELGYIFHDFYFILFCCCDDHVFKLSRCSHMTASTALISCNSQVTTFSWTVLLLC